MMMKMMKTVMMLTALMSLTACDFRAAKDFSEERSESLYQAAMKDYTAGRLSAAVDGFEKAIRANPSNASARFQLACLQQDRNEDAPGVYANLREYLLLAGKSEKSATARERFSVAERRLANELVKKYNLAGNEAMEVELADLKERLAAATKSLAQKEKELSMSMDSVKALRGENDRLHKLLASLDDPVSGDDEKPSNEPVTAKSLLDEGADEDRTEIVEEAKKFDQDADRDEVDASPLLPKKDKAKAVENKSEKQSDSSKALEDKPEEYVVQDGDTLYKIANRFYGKTSAWKAIREANKEKITVDGRIRAGQKIKLP